MSTLTKPQMNLLEDLLRHSVKKQELTVDGSALIHLGFIDATGSEFVITEAGRMAYAAQANREADAEDAEPVADPGPVVRMIAHIKEASMVAYRFGYNGAKAKAPSTGSVDEAFAPSGIFSRDEIWNTLRRALDQSTTDDFIHCLTNFLVNQIEHGLVTGKK